MREPYKLVVEDNEVRGLTELSFQPDCTTRLARAFGQLVKERFATKRERARIAVGYDARSTSPALANGLIRGLSAEGIHVLDLGLVPAPVLYYAIRSLKLEGGIVITGSHRPTGWNGARLYMGRQPLDASVTEYVVSQSRMLPNMAILPMIGQVTSLHFIPDYIRAIEREFEPIRKTIEKKPIHVVVSTGNGASSLTCPQLLQRLGCRIVKYSCNTGARSETARFDTNDAAWAREVGATVRAADADLGILIDGDGDRVRVLDHTGELVRPDLLFLLFSQSIGDRCRGARVASDLRRTDLLDECVRSWNGRLLTVSSGHTARMDLVHMGNVKLAASYEGHYHFADRFLGFDDATYASLRLVEYLARVRTEKPGTTLRDLIPHEERFQSPLKRVVLRDERSILNTLGDILREAKKDEPFIEGILEDHDRMIRVSAPGGWGVVRHEPETRTVSLFYEADGEDTFLALGDLLRDAVSSAQDVLFHQRSKEDIPLES
ncbi:MAG: hypothetical protein HKN20_04640 [Gemmatimonadetes bacterium]|nr:hypothetical protein [Gemmatimonadota bacterium]